MNGLWDSYWFKLIIIILILLLAALFTLLEYSVVKVRPSELKELRQTRKVKRAEHMVANLNEYLSTAQVGVTMTSLVLGWLGDEFITDLLLKINIIPHDVLQAIAPVIGVLIFTFFHAVFTDLVPKNMAIDRPVPILLSIGEMDKEDVIFMQRAFEMNDKVAEDIMIDRTQLAVIDITASIEDAAKLYFEKKFTRFPVVANNDKDHILGYIFAYDIMRQNQINPQQSVRTIMRRIPIVYENEQLTNVLAEMMKKQVPIVVVQDEYGGTSGIITDKDIYEELFGTVGEEIDHATSDMIEKKDPDSKGNPTFEVSGKMPLDDFERYFDTNIEQFDNSEVTTLTGFFLERQYDLKVGQPIRVDNFSFTPLDLRNAYVNKFKVVYIKPKKKKPSADEDQNKEK